MGGVNSTKYSDAIFHNTNKGDIITSTDHLTLRQIKYIGGGATSFSQEPLIVRGLRFNGFRLGHMRKLYVPDESSSISISEHQ